MITLDQHMEQSQREYLAHVLAMTNGNVTRAARIAHVHRTTIVRLLARHALNRPANRRWDLEARV